VPPKCQFLQETHGVTYRKTPFFIVTAVKTSNFTQFQFLFQTILNSRKHITKTVDYQLLEPWLGTGLLTSTGSHFFPHFRGTYLKNTPAWRLNPGFGFKNETFSPMSDMRFSRRDYEEWRLLECYAVWLF
jgi:hypothetical protein